MFFDHQTALKNLLDRDMNRRQFLMYIGAVIVGMIGITSLLDNLLGQKPGPKRQITSDGAYGGGAYGGAKSSGLNVKVNG